MILVANEGVDRPVVERLRQDDHDVVYVAELSPSITDEEILQLANARSAVLLRGAPASSCRVGERDES